MWIKRQKEDTDGTYQYRFSVAAYNQQWQEMSYTDPST